MFAPLLCAALSSTKNMFMVYLVAKVTTVGKIGTDLCIFSRCPYSTYDFRQFSTTNGLKISLYK